MAKIANRDVRNHVMRKEVFETNNETIFSKRVHSSMVDVYVVYSYGYHFPMYVYDYNSGEWYGNSDKYSRTTSSHQGYARPPNVSHWYETDTLRRIACWGLAGAVQYRMAA